MKLLLDEHFSPRVAVEFRRGGHDAEAVAERSDLRGRSDLDVFAAARREARAIVTQDFADFAAVVREAAFDEVRHHGVIFVPLTLWRSRQDVQHLVDALTGFLAEHLEEAVAGGVAWLGD